MSSTTTMQDIPEDELVSLIESLEQMPVGDHKSTADPATAARIGAANKIVGRMWRLGMIERWTSSQLRRTDLGRGGFEDLLQNTALHMIRTLASRERGWLRGRSGNVYSVLFNMAGQAATASAENYSERYGIAGATNVFRRSQKYRVAEARLARELGRTPTEQEVLDKLNQDPRVGVREAKWDGANHRLPEMAGTVFDHEGATEDHADVSLTAAHAIATIAATVRQQHPGRPELVTTLNAWFEGLSSGLISPEDDRIEVVALMVFGRPIDQSAKKAAEASIKERFDCIDAAVVAFRRHFGDR